MLNDRVRSVARSGYLLPSQLRNAAAGVRDRVRKGARQAAAITHETTRMRLSVMAMAGGHELPLHDHPGCWGMTLVLGGRARVRRYHRVGLVGQGRVARLQYLGESRQGPGGLLRYGRRHANLHAVSAEDADTVLLNLRVGRLGAMTSYFPFVDSSITGAIIHAAVLSCSRYRIVTGAMT
ncbi:MAG: hypothetical protein ABFS23_07780 [Pseudomonadota bacterium]